MQNENCASSFESIRRGQYDRKYRIVSSRLSSVLFPRSHNIPSFSPWKISFSTVARKLRFFCIRIAHDVQGLSRRIDLSVKLEEYDESDRTKYFQSHKTFATKRHDYQLVPQD